jgi:hypothetical protein
MKKKHKEAIEKIMTEMVCDYNFKCYQKGRFKFCCDVKLTPLLNDFVRCSQDRKKYPCGIGLSFGDDIYCACPLRVYVAKNLSTLSAFISAQ